MASPTSENESAGNKNTISLYSNYFLNRLYGFYAFSSSNFIGTLSNIRHFASRFRSRKRRGECLPLPWPSLSPDFTYSMMKPSRIHDVLEDICEHILRNLDSIEENLQFWQNKDASSHARKARFMICERGPRNFIDGTVHLLGRHKAHGSFIQQLSQSASIYINERVIVLSSLRYSLATFLAQVYVEVDRIGEVLVNDPEQKLPSLLGKINDLFSTVESSIRHLHATCQINSSVGETCSFTSLFEKLPKTNYEGSQWTDCEIGDAVNCVYLNLYKLDSYISILVTKHRKPRRISQYWIRYSCGAVGLSICSIWLLQRSRLMGSSDIDNWVRKAKDSMTMFSTEHVEQPLFAGGFRKRHEGIVEQEEVQLTSKSLHRYEEDLKRLTDEELTMALLTRVQELKDIEAGMLELNQMIREYKIKSAVLVAFLGALPAFYLSLLLFIVARAWFKQDRKAEGRRTAHRQRRQLVMEVEKRILQCQKLAEEGMEGDAQYMFGLLLYSLNRLYHSVKGPAKAFGEWQFLHHDMICLARPSVSTSSKLAMLPRVWYVLDTLNVDL